MKLDFKKKSDMIKKCKIRNEGRQELKNIIKSGTTGNVKT